MAAPSRSGQLVLNALSSFSQTFFNFGGNIAMNTTNTTPPIVLPQRSTQLMDITTDDPAAVSSITTTTTNTPPQLSSNTRQLWGSPPKRRFSNYGNFFGCENLNVNSIVSQSHNFALDSSKVLNRNLVIHREIPSADQNGGQPNNTPHQWSPADLPCVQFKHPSTISCPKTIHTNTQFTYFEVKMSESMFSSKTEAAPEIGLGFAPSGFKGMVGWSKDTIAFHMDNGRVYDERDSTNRIADRVFMTHVKKGDVIGCLMNHRNGEFLVVRNGQELHNLNFGTVFIHDRFKRSGHKDPIKYLPTISCSDINIDMEVNLGLDLVNKPFVYPRVVCCREREKMFEMVKILQIPPLERSFNQQQNNSYFSDIQLTTVSSEIVFQCK